jgi:predicted transcriptional regulator
MRVSGELCSIESNEPVEHAVRCMSEHDFSQISIHPRQAPRGVAQRVASVQRARSRTGAVKREPRRIDHCKPAFPFVDVSTPVVSAVDDDHA